MFKTIIKKQLLETNKSCVNTQLTSVCMHHPITSVSVRCTPANGKLFVELVPSHICYVVNSNRNPLFLPRPIEPLYPHASLPQELQLL